MAWRVARSLIQLRDEVDARSPDRSRASDGTIGDSDHAGRWSDHNPWVDDDVVTARDVTAWRDVAQNIWDTALATRDDRVKYMILNRRIVASYPVGSYPPWTVRPYYGSNPHTSHIHVSVRSDKRYYDDDRPWGISEEDDVAVTRSIQEALRDAGHDPGPVDGDWGPRTHAAAVAAWSGADPKPARKLDADTAFRRVARHVGHDPGRRVDRADADRVVQLVCQAAGRPMEPVPQTDDPATDGLIAVGRALGYEAGDRVGPIDADRIVDLVRDATRG